MQNSDCQLIVFSNKAYNAIINESFKKDPLETGGILLGHVLDNGIWIVMEVLPPGWDSIFQYSYFEYDEQFVNYLAQSVASQYEQELSLLGLWHRHPGSMDAFSKTDDETNKTFAGLSTKGAISGLVNIDPKFRLTIYHVITPLQYNRKEIEVGDDLIPTDFLKLKYDPVSKGLNPDLESEKNNNKHDEKYLKDSLKKKQENKNVYIFSSNCLFAVISIIVFAIVTFTIYSYGILKGESDINSLYRIYHSGYPVINQQGLDSVRNKANEEFEKKCIYDNRSESFKEKIDPEDQKQILIKADKGLKEIIFLLLLTIFLSISLTFIPKKINRLTEWVIIGFCAFISFVAVFSFTSSNSLYSIIWWLFIFFTLCVIAFISIIIYPFICLQIKEYRGKTNGKSMRYWFQKDPDLYYKEESIIKESFPYVEKSIENGFVSFAITIPSQRNNPNDSIMFQIVYPLDYQQRKTDVIKIYPINPDLSDLTEVFNNRHINVDEVGERFLNFSKDISGKVNGVQVIDKFIKRIHDYKIKNRI